VSIVHQARVGPFVRVPKKWLTGPDDVYVERRAGHDGEVHGDGGGSTEFTTCHLFDYSLCTSAHFVTPAAAVAFSCSTWVSSKPLVAAMNEW
jgi:hypothetical protein